MYYYIALGNDGKLYKLGNCDTFDEADNRATELGIEAVWLLTLNEAKDWQNVISEIERELS